MTIGQQLRKIAGTESTQEKKEEIEKVQEQIEGHQEKKMLTAFLEEAKRGKNSLCIGKTLPPDLSKEGVEFSLDEFKTGFVASW